MNTYDTDSLAVAQITPEDLFVNGKPRLIGSVRVGLIQLKKQSELIRSASS